MGICHFIFFFFALTSISSVYFSYLYINNSLSNEILNSNIDNVIEACFFITAIVVNSLVHDYFYTFRYCWSFILIIFDSMITNYLVFLGYMVDKLLVFPTCLILGITSCILLSIVRLILKDLLTIKVQK